MDSEGLSGPTTRRRNLRTASSRMPVHTIDSDSDVEEVTSPKPQGRASKRIKRIENIASPVTVDDGEEGVRAPIPQQTATLANGDVFATLATARQLSNGNAPFVDLKKMYKEQTTRTKKEVKVASQPVYDSLRDYQPDSRAFVPSTSRSNQSLRNANAGKLSDIYRPPVDLIVRGTFDAARTEATKKIRWLLVTVHNYLEFKCQTFVRDVLNHEAVKEIIKENFVFWSVNHDTSDGLRYSAHYKVTGCPYLAIIDPRTGEKILDYDSDLDVLKFCHVTTEFLAEKPSYDPVAAEKLAESAVRMERSDSTNSSNSVQFVDQEEEELQRAIQLSEREEQKRKKASADIVDIEDTITVGFGDDDDDAVEEEPSARPSISAPPTVDPDAYKEFLGASTDPEITLKIRLPTGNALDLTLPNSSQLQAVLKFIETRGFPGDKFEVMTSYPKRNLSELDKVLTLAAAGFSSREMLIVQQRE